MFPPFDVSQLTLCRANRPAFGSDRPLTSSRSLPRIDNMPQWERSRPLKVTDNPPFGAHMSKRARKRRSRKGRAANHGRKPNA